MKEEITSAVAAAVDALYQVATQPALTRPDEQFGDYSTNVAMRLAKQLGANPRDVAEAIVDQLAQQNITADVAGPGFINVTVPDSRLYQAVGMATVRELPLTGKTIVAEYSDANAFKALHAGHLYTSLVGDAVANILSAAGGDVKRVNFGGDVGMHVARAMWGIIQEFGGEFPEKLADIAIEKRAEWVSGHYVTGTNAYKQDETAQTEIIALNKRVYEIHTNADHESPFAQIYWTCRQWSYEGFDQLYQRLNMHPFDKYYPESEVWELGLQTVKAHTGSVYEESDGAVVFRGEDHGLFTQVFINSEGLPTYAGKDVGLIQHKQKDYAYDLSYIITDAAQKDHMRVVMKSIEQFEPELVARTVHHTHGRVVFADGRKMSSREGNVIMAQDVMDAAQAAAGEVHNDIVLGAVRYSFLKNRIGGDIAYDPEESVAREGNSGPYLQYALVRARSILRKISDVQPADSTTELDGAERSLARKLTMYGEAFEAALADYSPHHLCTYLYELSQVFNRFYEQSRVIDDPRASIRLQLVRQYEAVLNDGLAVLGMPRPEEM